jgi:hypothetical protein
VPSIEEYKKLLGDRIKGMTEDEIEAWYNAHITFLSFIVKGWLESRDKKCGKASEKAPTSTLPAHPEESESLRL